MQEEKIIFNFIFERQARLKEEVILWTSKCGSVDSLLVLKKKRKREKESEDDIDSRSDDNIYHYDCSVSKYDAANIRRQFEAERVSQILAQNCSWIAGCWSNLCVCDCVVVWHWVQIQMGQINDSWRPYSDNDSR